MNVTPATVFGGRRRETAPTENHSTEQSNSDDESKKARRINADLGNKELPIVNYREQIVEAVDKSRAVVVTAETGAGKSTQVPQFLAEEGYEVIITQPRVMAARTVADRIKDEVVAAKGDEFGTFVGYRTARERGDHPDNRILAVTDGLQLVRELSGSGTDKKQVLVLDEVHEWNENMEVLVAWAKQRMNKDPNFKVVTMSATMESEALAGYFADDDEHEVPVIEVPGRTFEVERHQGGEVVSAAIKLAKEGKNTLVFVPGKAEIKEVVERLQAANLGDATVLPLHGELSPQEQRRVLAKYDGVKVVVSTNVAQTSITIDDIDAVVDSGLERQKQVRNGVEGLYLNPISQADCLQRAGRAGRTHEGEYYLAKLGNSPLKRLEERPAYGVPEIERVLLDGMVLRLAAAKLDAAEMDFFHQPDPVEVANAKERLQKLGALNDKGEITKVGRLMERMPIESRYARMMVEARKYSTEVRLQLAALLAVREAGGICVRSTKSNLCRESWSSLVSSKHNDSDMIKQLEVFIQAQTMSSSERRENDIHTKAYSNANGILRQLRGVEKLKDGNLTMPTDEEREQLVKCIIAGMVDSLYVGSYGTYTDARGDRREMSKRSMIRPERMVVGTPFDLQINNRYGQTTLHLIEGATNVPSIDVLREVAPQLYSESDDGYRYVGDKVVKKCTIRFDGKEVGTTTQEIAPGPERRRAYAQVAVANYRSTMLGHVDEQIKELSDKSGLDIPPLSHEEVVQKLTELVPDDVTTLSEVTKIDVLSIYDIVPKDMVEEIRKTSPDEYLGFPMRYKDGVPYVDIDDLELVPSLPTELERLPDGREVKIGFRSIPEAREYIIQERERRELDGKIVYLKNQINDIFVPSDISELVDAKFELLKEIDSVLSRSSNSEKREALAGIPRKIVAFQQNIEHVLERIQLEEKATAEREAMNEMLYSEGERIRFQDGIYLTKREMTQELLDTREALLQKVKDYLSQGCTLDQVDDLRKSIDSWLVDLKAKADEDERARRDAYERNGPRSPRGRREPRGSRQPRGGRGRSRTDRDHYDPSLEGSNVAYASGSDGETSDHVDDGTANPTPGELGYGSMGDMLEALAGHYGSQ